MASSEGYIGSEIPNIYTQKHPSNRNEEDATLDLKGKFFKNIFLTSQKKKYKYRQ